MEALADVRAAIGGVGGEAQIIGRNGKAIVFGGAPNLGFSVDPTQPEFNSLELVEGQWPKNGEETLLNTSRGLARSVMLNMLKPPRSLCCFTQGMPGTRKSLVSFTSIEKKAGNRWVFGLPT